MRRQRSSSFLHLPGVSHGHWYLPEVTCWRSALHVSGKLLIYLFHGNGLPMILNLVLHLPWIQNFSPSPRFESVDQSPMKVAQLIDHELHTWKNSLVRDMFSPISAQAILSILIPYWPKPDKLLWIPDSRGLFSVKSAYKELLPTPPPQASSNVNWSKLWKFKGP